MVIQELSLKNNAETFFNPSTKMGKQFDLLDKNLKKIVISLVSSLYSLQINNEINSVIVNNDPSELGDANEASSINEGDVDANKHKNIAVQGSAVNRHNRLGTERGKSRKN